MKQSAIRFFISLFVCFSFLSLAGYSADFTNNKILEQKDKSSEQDKKTFQNYQREANQCNPKAQIKLGEFYEKGIGVEKNLTQAFTWYKAAADQNHMTAFAHVARCYSNGIGVEKSLQKAKKYDESYNFMNKHNAEFNWDEQ